jgi:hypothetical protein
LGRRTDDQLPTTRQHRSAAGYSCLLVTCTFAAPTARADTLTDNLKKSGSLAENFEKFGLLMTSARN